MFRRQQTMVCAALLCGAFLFPISAAYAAGKKAAAESEGDEEGGATNLAAGCKSELLLDANSGEELFEQNSHERLRPASMVKLMTAYVVQMKIDEGEIQATDIVTTSAKASHTGGSRVYLKEGEKFTVQQLLEAVLIQSANDAAEALAEHVAGSADAFVDLMNETAKDLGMKESEFHFPHGLPPAKGQLPDLVSAHDFGILARALVTQHPKVLECTAKVEAPFRDGLFIMRNHNKLVIHFPGCDGLKTGFYDLAGFSVTATAQRNGERMIAVIMGCHDRKVRDEEAAKLLTKGFSQFKSVRLAKKGESLQARIKVTDGERPDIQAIAAEDVRASLRPGDESKVVQKAALCTDLKAPVLLSAPCGTVGFFVGDKEVARVNALTGEEVGPASGFRKFMSYFGR